MLARNNPCRGCVCLNSCQLSLNSALTRDSSSPSSFLLSSVILLIVHRQSMLQLFLQYIQWGKKVFTQPPVVQVLPLKKMREACNFPHRYTSTMRDKMRKKKKSRKSHGLIFKEFGCKLWWKISIWSIKVNLNVLLYTLCWQ